MVCAIVSETHYFVTMTDDSEIHDLFDFMQQVSDEMAAEYLRIQKRASGDPGTAGDQGEENWATILRGWLPSNYEVVTKGRIISHDGRVSPQIDIVVLSSTYPSKMRDKKLFLAGGVLAAFECKNTLRSSHISKVVETSKIIKSMSVQRTGTPYNELQTPIIFGLLAHSHSWHQPNSKPIENVSTELLAKEMEKTEHPRELLDLICVADLASWSRTKMIIIGTNIYGMKNDDGTPVDHGAVNTALVCHSEDQNTSETSKPFTPIGSLVGMLFQKIAYEDKQVGIMARYYTSVGITGNGSGKIRPWSDRVFSDKTKSEILNGKLVFGSFEDEWSAHFS